jgi:hypothetical protein
MERLISRAAASLALATLASGCIVFVFTHERINAPVDEARVAELKPGESTFGDALARLGAPTDAWELAGGARALAYGWSDERGDNVNLQVPVSRDFTPNLELESGRANLHGFVLFFDAADVLVEVRRGYLRELERASKPSAEDE